MQTKDIELTNAQTLKAIKGGDLSAGTYYGFVDAAFLDVPPFVMFTNNDCSVCTEILRTGGFELGSMRLWVKLAQSATGILDIGAYSGIFALAAAAARPDLTVHAYEPNPFTCARLRLNKVANKLWNIADHHRGIAANAGYAKLKWIQKRGASLSSTATFVEMTGVEEHQIETTMAPVDNLNQPPFVASLGQRALIKIDVEGIEQLVFQGISAALQNKPDIILETFSAEACAAVDAMITPLGYRVYVMHEDTGALEPQDRLRPSDPRSQDRNHLLTTRPPP